MSRKKGRAEDADKGEPKEVPEEDADKSEPKEVPEEDADKDGPGRTPGSQILPILLVPTLTSCSYTYSARNKRYR